ncbi:MAG: hypothetical protein H0U45_16000 [Tatlockia sp.]|jgi:hypothetical protein|nr:hypothetical protein [Tatlockia sp.]
MTENKSSEFENFNNVMDALLAVPYKELQDKLEEEKRVKGEQKKKRPTSSASHASSNAKKQAR